MASCASTDQASAAPRNLSPAGRNLQSAERNGHPAAWNARLSVWNLYPALRNEHLSGRNLHLAGRNERLPVRNGMLALRNRQVAGRNGSPAMRNGHPPLPAGKMAAPVFSFQKGALFFGLISHPTTACKPMQQKDLNRLTMWKAVYQVLQENKPTWQDNAGFSEAVDDLKRFIDAATSAAGRQAAGGTTGITTDKESLADAAIDKTLRITKLARAYARKAGNATLLDAVDYSKGSLQKTPFDELAARLNSMLSAAAEVKTELAGWGYKEGWDAEAAAAISAFSQSAPGTRVAISGRKAVTATLPQVMRGGKAELLVLDDLVGLYEDDAPDFVGTYKAARSIVNVGKRHEAPAPQDAPAS